MEKDIEKQTGAKVKNTTFNIIIIILIILITLIIFAILFNNKQTPLSENTLNKNSASEPNSPIVSLIPNEKNEIDDTQTIIDENTTQSITGSSEPENESNANENTNLTPNLNTDTKPNSNLNNSTNNNSNTNMNTNSNSNANSNNNNSNTNTDSEETTTQPSTPTVTPHKIKTETSTDLTKTETKYGVIIKTYTTNIYDIYSDGSKKILSSSSKIEYDRTNYNATTAELLPEARTVQSQYSSIINQVFNKTNSYRQEANVNSVNSITNRNNLSLNENLCVAACARAIEIAYSSKFSHTRPNGTKCYTILKEMNISYRTAGENISYGYSSADAVCEGWKNSQGHYENMILPDFSQIGIGVFKMEGTLYWVQIFN